MLQNENQVGLETFDPMYLLYLQLDAVAEEQLDPESVLQLRDLLLLGEMPANLQECLMGECRELCNLAEQLKLTKREISDKFRNLARLYHYYQNRNANPNLLQ